MPGHDARAGATLWLSRTPSTRSSMAARRRRWSASSWRNTSRPRVSMVSSARGRARLPVAAEKRDDLFERGPGRREGAGAGGLHNAPVACLLRATARATSLTSPGVKVSILECPVHALGEGG